MIVDKLEEIAKVQASAISNVDFDKVVVYDSGKGDAVGNFLGGLTKALPPFHEVAKMAGIELPEFLGEMAKEGGPSKVRVEVEKAPASVDAATETDTPAAE